MNFLFYIFSQDMILVLLWASFSHKTYTIFISHQKPFNFYMCSCLKCLKNTDSRSSQPVSPPCLARQASTLSVSWLFMQTRNSVQLCNGGHSPVSSFPTRLGGNRRQGWGTTPRSADCANIILCRNLSNGTVSHDTYWTIMGKLVWNGYFTLQRNLVKIQWRNYWAWTSEIPDLVDAFAYYIVHIQEY